MLRAAAGFCSFATLHPAESKDYNYQDNADMKKSQRCQSPGRLYRCLCLHPGLCLLCLLSSSALRPSKDVFDERLRQATLYSIVFEFSDKSLFYVVMRASVETRETQHGVKITTCTAFIMFVDVVEKCSERERDNLWGHLW